MTEEIDVKEQALADRDPDMLKTLLVDHTTLGNLRWATDDYVSLGEGFSREDEMTVKHITGDYAEVIRPRVLKTAKEQKRRTRNRAEVFTAAWVCNAQNNLVDAAWFGWDPYYNAECKGGWKTSALPIVFDNGHTWQEFVAKNVLEITCGEAPYITTRYDVSPCHGVIQVRGAVADRDADARTREHVHDIGLLRLLHGGQDVQGNRGRFARRPFQRHRLAVRQEIGDSLQPQVGPNYSGR